MTQRIMGTFAELVLAFSFHNKTQCYGQVYYTNIKIADNSW